MKPHPVLTLLALLTLLTLSLSLIKAPAAPLSSLSVRLDQPGPRVSPLLWGVFFEDINLSADGGIYPELVRNRSFEDADQPEHWRLIHGKEGQSEMTTDTQRPLNPFNRRSLQVRVRGEAALVNEGYWGMNLVEGDEYQIRFAARASDGFQGPLIFHLQDRDGRDLAMGQVDRLTEQWHDYTLDLKPTGSEPKGRLAITFSGQGQLWLDMVSVLPKKTWKGHGLRPDLCEMLAGLKPAFLRFPGGCWVEGHDMSRMYQWKETIGNIACRQPLFNIWGYYATHGLGYHEYLQLSEDLGAEPLFCINVGMSHTEVVPLDQMGPWVQDALDAIEYANGPTNSLWGSLRAQNGHPEPFHMKYLEIGNENGGPAYHERWELFYRAIKAQYPDIQLVANVWGGYPTKSMPDIIDEHYYNNPEFFMREAHKYDSYNRAGPKVFVGEYAVTQGCGQGNLRGAIGEAAFMTGLERNGDVVTMAAYAPLFVNVNHRRWNPDLINFDSSRVYGLPSYYVQQLFSVHRGDVVLPVDLQAPEVAPGVMGGAIGVGTWLTQAEFKDIKVTRNGQTLFASDFTHDTRSWQFLGDGNWRVEAGALRQSSGAENVRAVVGDHAWTDYTYSLKARKLGGAEGFLILFRVQNDNAKSWWNLGGWGNQRHAIEMGGIVGNEVSGHIETGRWYDIRIEVHGPHIKCYLDDKLIHDVQQPTLTALYASATLDEDSGDTILKVVNVDHQPQATQIQILGASRVAAQARAMVLTSKNPEDENSLEEPRKVAPVSTTLSNAGTSFRHEFPPNSLTILRLQAQR